MGDNEVMVLFERHLCRYSLPLLEFVDSIGFDSPATSFMHPMTLLNKVLVGFADGHVELWNVRTGRLIHCFSTKGAMGEDSKVTCMAQSTVAEVVAIGRADGRVSLLDVMAAKQLFVLEHGNEVEAVQSLSFRTGKEDEPLMAVGLASGRIALWNLENHQLVDTWTAHSLGGAHVQFLEGQPLILSSGRDNALCLWLLEDGKARLLKGRSGHSKPSTLLCFYENDEEGEVLLSAGGDRSFRIISLQRDSQSGELSQGPIKSNANKTGQSVEELRFEQITDFACYAKKDVLTWDNLLTCHAGSPTAHTWRTDHRRVGTNVLRSKDNSPITCVATSACGHFGLVGTISGAIDVFNMQSGLLRRHIQSSSSSHIAFLAVSPDNAAIIALHADATLTVWDFASPSRLRYSHSLSKDRCIKATFNGDAMLLAMADSTEILLFDVENVRPVRRFPNPSGSKAVALSFSADGRWLLAGFSFHARSLVHTWDLATGTLIDTLSVSHGDLVSFALSPSGHTLALSLRDSLAIQLFTNRTLYSAVSLLPLSTSLLPTDVAAIEDGLVNLSLQPRSKWLHLCNMEETKARNKPLLPPKPLEKSPFFLDTLVQKRPSLQEVGQADVEPEVNKHETDLFQNSDNRLFDVLAAMSSTDADFELRSLLITEEPSTLLPLIRLFDCISARLSQGQDYELCLAFLSILLKAHAHEIMLHRENNNLMQSIQQASTALKQKWQLIEPLFHQTLCFAIFARE